MSDDLTAEAPESPSPDDSTSGAEVSEVDEPSIPSDGDEDDAGMSPEASDVERELRDAAQRVQADFENYRKRVLHEQTAIVERATEGLIEQLLPVLDSFELALGTLDDLEPKVRKGVELVYAELLGVLERAGLERIDTDNAPFDPNVHEAVLHEDGDGEPVVAETMRDGYRLKGKVLRPAMVKVAR